MAPSISFTHPRDEILGLMQRIYGYRMTTTSGGNLSLRDENGDIYDLTKIFIEELARHPFAKHDDVIDAASRIYDINPYAPQLYQWQSTTSLEADIEELEACVRFEDEQQNLQLVCAHAQWSSELSFGGLSCSSRCVWLPWR